MFLKWQNCGDRELLSGCRNGMGWRRVWIQRSSMSKFFCGDEAVLYIDGGHANVHDTKLHRLMCVYTHTNAG